MPTHVYTQIDGSLLYLYWRGESSGENNLIEISTDPSFGSYRTLYSTANSYGDGQATIPAASATLYYIRISGIDNTGTTSDFVYITAMSPLSPITWDATAGSITVHWTADPLAQISITRLFGDGTHNLIAAVSGSQGEYTDTDPAPMEQYQYEVCASEGGQAVTRGIEGGRAATVPTSLTISASYIGVVYSSLAGENQAVWRLTAEQPFPPGSIVELNRAELNAELYTGDGQWYGGSPSDEESLTTEDSPYLYVRISTSDTNTYSCRVTVANGAGSASSNAVDLSAGSGGYYGPLINIASPAKNNAARVYGWYLDVGTDDGRPMTNDLTIQLGHTGDDMLNIPSSVTIPAGSSLVSVTIPAPDISLSDGFSESVTILDSSDYTSEDNTTTLSLAPVLQPWFSTPIESRTAHAPVGNYLGMNDGDANGNGIIDWADLPSNLTNYGQLFFGIPNNAGIDLASAKVRFQYSASYPSGVMGPTAGHDYYELPGTGNFRLWKDFSRDPRDIENGGSFIAPNDAISALTTCVMVEAVRPTDTLSDSQITVQLSIDGGATYPLSATIDVVVYGNLIALDANGDGAVAFSSTTSLASDQTSSNNPYHFWLNDNHDALDDGKADNKGHPDYVQLPISLANPPDYSTGIINNAADLEDFGRIRMQTPAGYNPATWSVGLSFNNPNIYNPDSAEILLFNVSVPDAQNYLTNPATAGDLVNEKSSYDMHAGTSVTVTGISGTSPFDLLFEAAKPGQGTLTITFFENGTQVASSNLYLDLCPITDFYDTYTVGDGHTYTLGNSTLGSYTWPDPATNPGQYSIYSLLSGAQVPNQTGNYILLVTGWRMTQTDMTEYADSALKRLFLQGYRGGFELFEWPTEWISTIGIKAIRAPLQRRDLRAIAANFAESEERAFYSGTALESLLEALYGQYKNSSTGQSQINILSHSMGAYAVSEALQEYATAHSLGGAPPLVDTYIASQGATWTESYDGSGGNLTNGKDEYQLLKSANGSAYFSNLGSAAHDVVNFYNPVDNAMENEWDGNFLGGNYDIDGYSARGAYRFFSPLGIQLNDLDDRYRILSFASQFVTTPIGMTADVGGPFDKSKQQDLTAFGFGKNPLDHSAEFLGTDAQTYKYWSQVLIAMGLK